MLIKIDQVENLVNSNYIAMKYLEHLKDGRDLNLDNLGKIICLPHFGQ